MKSVFIILFLSVCACMCYGRSAVHDGRYIKLSSSERKLLSSIETCTAVLVESIPDNLTYFKGAPKFLSTFDAWNILMDSAEQTISIASFYWTLLANGEFNGSISEQGRAIHRKLMNKAKSKTIKLRIAQNYDNITDNPDLTSLIEAGAMVRLVDVRRFRSAGILHTKLWTVDGKHGYLGSANMDWRSLTQVKELGMLILNCPELVQDLEKIWRVYWFLGQINSTIPRKWPIEMQTEFNSNNPMKIKMNEMTTFAYLSSSPPLFNPPGRNNDLDALLSVISNARKFVYISVMDYMPVIFNYSAHGIEAFWPIIDDALRKAAIERQIEIRLLISEWPYSKPYISNFLNSLKAIMNIHARRFIVNSVTELQRKISHARVNHNKYMVTDKEAFIGTSNWSGEYFLYTGGVSLIVRQNQSTCGSDEDDEQGPLTIRQQLVHIFKRDWGSDYAIDE